MNNTDNSQTVSSGKESIARELLGAGANMNAKTVQGDDSAVCYLSTNISLAIDRLHPRHYAASKQHIQVRNH